MDPRLFEDAEPVSILQTCERRSCDHAVYINDACDPVDSSGNSLEALVVHVGDRVCFFNNSEKCKIKLKFNSELFSATSVPLDNRGDCRNLAVLSTGRGKHYSYEILCDCEGGHGIGNPEVHVEEEDEEDP